MNDRPITRNMPLWCTADIILRDWIDRYWNPHFERGAHGGFSGEVLFGIFSNESDLLSLVPPEDRSDFIRLMSEAKANLFAAVDFRPENWLYHAINDYALSAMTCELNDKICAYECAGGGDVRTCFYNSLLYSDWDYSLAFDIHFSFE